MKQLDELKKRFLKEASDVLPSSHRRMLVAPVKRCSPIVPQDAWARFDDGDVDFIAKTFSFESLSERNEFILDAIDAEAEHKHCSVMTVDDLHVHVKLFTRTVKLATDRDKEIAAYLDEVYSDVTLHRIFTSSREHT